MFRLFLLLHRLMGCWGARLRGSRWQEGLGPPSKMEQNESSILEIGRRTNIFFFVYGDALPLRASATPVLGGSDVALQRCRGPCLKTARPCLKNASTMSRAVADLVLLPGVYVQRTRQAPTGVGCYKMVVERRLKALKVDRAAKACGSSMHAALCTGMYKRSRRIAPRTERAHRREAFGATL